ncbi:MAG: putative transcriptional regulator [Clostridiales bacterium]|jgi:sugar-specific transcriptional regulator TrmB|nr:putative transcriptional regulator [Clostridiales bacterium]
MYEVEIIDCLTKLNFTKLEAQVYLVLLESGPLSGYQVAKKIEISRSSIYNALDHMYEKGIVMLLSDKTSTYVAEKPETLFNKLNYEYIENSKKAIRGLTELFETKHEERHSNFKGFESAIFKTKELLNAAESEVYINMDFDLSYFREELVSLNKRGVRIVVFSFYQINTTNIDIELYSHNRPVNPTTSPSRLMIVVDNKVTLLADTYKERATWLGTITNNSLMVSIIAEHIHNDIYLLKLRNNYGFIFDDKVSLHTKFENNCL